MSSVIKGGVMMTISRTLRLAAFFIAICCICFFMSVSVSVAQDVLPVEPILSPVPAIGVGGTVLMLPVPTTIYINPGPVWYEYDLWPVFPSVFLSIFYDDFLSTRGFVEEIPPFPAGLEPWPPLVVVDAPDFPPPDHFPYPPPYPYYPFPPY